jgi:hypothetical protein
MKGSYTKFHSALKKNPGPEGVRLESQIRQSCLQMLVPLAGLMLRAGVGAGEFSDLWRRAFVVTAAGELGAPHRRPNISRIAVATGLTRQEVARVLRTNKAPRKLALKQLQRANRVLAGWYVDSRYSIRRGVPRPLRIRGTGPTFQQLVRKYGGDVPPRAVLDELRRAAAIRTLPEGTIVPKRRAVEYRARSQRDLQDVSRKLGLLAETLRHNVDYPAATLFEDVALNNRLKPEHYPIAVRRLSASAKRFLSAAKQYLDRDERQASSDQRSSKSRSLGVGIFLFGKPR